MAVDVRFEVWTRQESGTYQRKFPIRGNVAASFTFDIFGRMSFALPQSHPYLDEIISIDQADRTNDEASIIRAFIDDTPLEDLYVTSMEVPFTDTAEQIAQIQGGNRGTALERSKVRQYDWNAKPSVEPDWLWGAGSNELSEDWDDLETVFDFEDGTVQGFSELTGTDTNPLTNYDNSVAEARNGTRSLEFNPTERHSGVVKTIDVRPGQRGQITVYLKSNTTGKRYTAFVEAGDDPVDFSTNGFVFNGQIMVELDNVAKNAANNGLPGGSTDGTWQSMVLDFEPDSESVKLGVQYDHHDATDGPVAYIDDVTIAGFGYGVAPWNERGNLADLDIATHPGNGTNALLFRPGDTVANVNGVQRIVTGQTQGVTKTFSVTLYHEAGADRDFILILKRPSGSSGGSWLTQKTVTIPTGVETEVDITAVIDSTIMWLEVRKADTTTPVDVYLDNPKWYAGLPPATIGKMLNDLLDDAGVDHAGDNRTSLAWLSRTFTDTQDSNSVDWVGVEELRVRRGMSMRQVIEAMGRLGYEFSVTVNPADDTDWRLNAYNPGTMGTDYSASNTVAILPRPGLISAGPFAVREPTATYQMVEGDEFQWAEYRDTDMETAWGEIEGYSSQKDVLGDSLLKIATDVVESDVSESLVLSFINPDLIPGVDYTVGDLIRITLGVIPSAIYRCIAVSVRTDTGTTVFQVEFQPTGAT